MSEQCDAVGQRRGGQCRQETPDVYQIISEDGPLVHLCAYHAGALQMRRRLVKHRDNEVSSSWVGPSPTRERMPETREGTTHHFEIYDSLGGTTDGYVQTGEYEDGRLGELFLKVGKQGEFHAVLDQWAISTSVALQAGADGEALFKKFVGSRFEPSGATSNKKIPRCTSVLDYLARWLIQKYYPSEFLGT